MNFNDLKNPINNMRDDQFTDFAPITDPTALIFPAGRDGGGGGAGILFLVHDCRARR